jgi:hypothetical protein
MRPSKKKDNMKAKAVKYNESEAQEVIRGKTRDFIHRQSEYHESVLIRLLKQERLTEMMELIRRSKDIGINIIKWNGYEMAIERANAEFVLEEFYYKRAIQNEETLKNSLIKEYGMTKDQVTEIVIFSRYVKKLKDTKPDGEPDVKE